MAIDLTSIIRKNKRYTLIIFSLLLVGLIFGFCYVVFVPKVQNLRSLEAQKEKKRADILKSQTALSQAPELKEDIGRMEAEITDYKKRLGKEVELSLMLKELINIARDLKIEFLSIKSLPIVDLKLGEGDKISFLSEIPISIKVKGGYNELLRFIGRIEKADRFIRVDDIEIKNDTKDIWRHNAEIVVSSFVLKSD